MKKACIWYITQRKQKSSCQNQRTKINENRRGENMERAWMNKIVRHQHRFFFYHWRKTCRRTGKASSTLHQYTAVNIPRQYRPFVPQPINLINYSRCASPPADDRCTMNGKHPRIKDKRTKAAHKQKNIASWNPSGDYFLVMVPGHCGDLQNAKIYIGENFWFSTAILPYCHCHTAILP